MTTPLRDNVRSSVVVSSSSAGGSPPASPQTPPPENHQQQQHHRRPSLPRRSGTVPTVAPATGQPRSPAFPSYGRHSATSSLRTQTITRISGASSTPRTRLARGGPPRASIRVPRRRNPRYPPDPPTLVRYHWSTVILLILYLPLLTIPWIIICVLDAKPLVLYGKSYQTSGWYTPTDLAWVPRWVRASNILTCFASAVAFPIVTTILSHAAVAFVQNVRPGQRVNARDLLSLADSCWMRIVGDRRTWLSKAGTMLIVLSMIVPLLQISAVRMEEVKIAACNDVPYPKNNNKACHRPLSFGYVVGGYDPEPADMAYTPGNLVARKVRSQLPTLSNLDSLEHIWPNVAGMGDNWGLDIGDTFYYYQKTSIKTIPFYVSNFPQNFNTGALREHAIRFNSTASCEIVPRSDFPAICPGAHALAGEFSNKETQNRFCVPGDYTTTPWTISRNRQDITEELWIDNYIPYDSVIMDMVTLASSNFTNLTVHCVASTTRGYFELPNYQNDGNAGELLTDWPSQATLEANFNDVQTFSSQPPTESDPRNKTEILVFRYGADPFDSWNQTTPGPLSILMNAMLGNESWFYPVQNATTLQEERDALVAACIRGMPLSTYTGYNHNGFSTANGRCSFLNFPGKLPQVEGDEEEGSSTNSSLTGGGSSTANQSNDTSIEIVADLSRVVAGWFSGFGYNASTEDALEAGMYLANEALLTLTADASKIDSARRIYTSNGTSVFKPSMRYPAKATVSLLMLLEIAGMVSLAVFIYRMPTFASRLDAVHVATIGSQLVRQMGDDLPPLSLRPRGLARKKYLKEMEDTDGLIGVQEEVGMTPLLRSSAVTPRNSATLTPAPSLYHSMPHPQPQGPTSGGHRPLSGSHISLPFNPRVITRPISFASTSHTDDDIISTLDAVSEAGGGPDAPPKYGDVVQADAQRASPSIQRKKLVVGGTGRITRDLAKRMDGQFPRGSTTSGNRGEVRSLRSTRRTSSIILPPPQTPTAAAAATVTSPMNSRNRSNRNSQVIMGGISGGQGIRSSRTA